MNRVYDLKDVSIRMIIIWNEIIMKENQGMTKYQCSICRELGDLTPPGASQPPSLYWPQKKIVKISQKYIAVDPPLVFPQIEYCEIS